MATEKFKWSIDLVAGLVAALKDYKTLMEFQNLDFNSDKPRMYEEIRRILARTNSRWFGPSRCSVCPENATEEEKKEFLSLIKCEKEHIKLGYNRVMEKTKELRQKFTQAVTNGTRSGSGKLVAEFYDDLIKIWGGTGSTESLPFGVESFNSSLLQSSEVEDEHDDDSGESSSLNVSNAPIIFFP